MILHCCLPSLPLAQVRRAFPAPHRVAGSLDWDALLEVVRDRRSDAVIVDPCVGGDPSFEARLGALAAAVSAAPGTPIVGYVSVTASAIRAAHLLTRLGASEIVVRGLDDAPDALAAAVRRAIAQDGATRLVSQSAELVEGLPPGVARAVTMVFHRPERVRSVSDLATAANTTRRSLDRSLARAGLAPARTLLSCARANAVFHLLAAGQVRPSGAASIVGYASPRALTREFRTITGHVPSAVPGRLTREVFVATLGRRLLRSAAPEP